MSRGLVGFVLAVAIAGSPMADGAALTTDQRGFTRPVAIVGPEPMCDVGAFEVQLPIKSGLWLGGDPATNTDVTPFDTGWAICFFVNEDGTALTPSTECDIDGDDDEAYLLEVSWNDDVGRNLGGEVGLCDGNPSDGSGIGIGDSTGLEVPIEDNSFVAPWPAGDVTGGEIRGTFNGDTATGTAVWDLSLGMGAGACLLDGGWTAAPVQ